VFNRLYILFVVNLNIDMSQQRILFRSSIFESIPSVIPLGASAFFLLAAVASFMRNVATEELPTKYTTTALLVSCAGVSFSFYVKTFLICRF